MVEWQNRLAVWLLYFTAASLVLVLLFSTWTHDEDALAVTCQDMWDEIWPPERHGQGWLWCLFTCALTSAVVFVTGLIFCLLIIKGVLVPLLFTQCPVFNVHYGTDIAHLYCRSGSGIRCFFHPLDQGSGTGINFFWIQDLILDELSF
jgi:hypothetical protein